jgi:hypothetical protein
MPEQTIYTVGGTVQAGGGLYIKRKADDKLLELCRNGEFAFILSSRQVGKSSLMVRTAQQLETENIRSVIIDLSAIGVKVSPDEWYLGILNEISTQLNLQTDIFTWWSRFAQLGQAQRLTNFFRDVLLKEVQERVVLFFDEIDSTLSIPFSDDFYIALRHVYNARSTVPDFKRLSFVLVGVATPSDLISDNSRTPFNIGHGVELNDFTLQEALPLADGLGEHAKQTLSEIFYFTNGHPYLTQLLCVSLINSKNPQNGQSVANAVDQLFTGEKGKKDNNLQFVRDMLTRRAPDTQQVLKIYKEVRSGKPVPDDERSIPKAHLKISGVVRRQDGQLVVRNRIYERAFDQQWIKENTPVRVSRRIAFASSFVAVVAVLFAAYFGYEQLTQPPAERAAAYEADFQTADSAQEQLAALAGLFELGGEYETQARNLFFQLPSNASRNLFGPSVPRSAREDQVVVVKGVYHRLNNVDEDNGLLAMMGQAVQESDPNLASEIRFWLAGREKLNQSDFYASIANLTEATNLNRDNPAIYFDRAQAYFGLGPDQYPAGFADLSKVLQLDTERRREVREIINANPELAGFAQGNGSEFPDLAFAVQVGVQRMIYDAETGSILPGKLVRKEGDPPTGDVVVDNLYDSLGIIYEFFWINYERDSIDDKGIEISATVHYKKSFDNSYWDGEHLVFGDGDDDLPVEERLFNNFTGSISVLTHEYVKGIIQYEAGLQFFSQPGALVTSYGDIFGVLVEQYQLNQTAEEADWIIGKGLFTSNVNGVGLRSLEAPGTAYDDPVLGKDLQPAHMDDYVNTVSDNGGVHINGGIPNHAFYLTALEMGGYAWEKAGRIWYITLRDKLQPDSDFQDAANQTFVVAGELYGQESPEQEAVRKGWAEVGITIED